MDAIYTLTVFGRDYGENIVPDHRTWGWFPSLEQADKSVRQASDLIFENDTYSVALIEEVQPDVFPLIVTRHWYRKVVGEELAAPIDEPAWAAGVYNFSMG